MHKHIQAPEVERKRHHPMCFFLFFYHNFSQLPLLYLQFEQLCATGSAGCIGCILGQSKGPGLQNRFGIDDAFNIGSGNPKPPEGLASQKVQFFIKNFIKQI